jgi:hypothetical protein
MDLESVLLQLRQERDKIDAAILSLERLNRPGDLGPGRRDDLAAKSRINGLNGNHRTADMAPGGE